MRYKEKKFLEGQSLLLKPDPAYTYLGSHCFKRGGVLAKVRWFSLPESSSWRGGGAHKAEWDNQQGGEERIRGGELAPVRQAARRRCLRGGAWSALQTLLVLGIGYWAWKLGDDLNEQCKGPFRRVLLGQRKDRRVSPSHPISRSLGDSENQLPSLNRHPCSL